MAKVARDRGRRWRRLRESVLNAHPLCVPCRAEGRTVAAVEVDHVLPLHLGGTDARGNLMPICEEHHSMKTARERTEAGWGKDPERGCGLDGVPHHRRDEG